MERDGQEHVRLWLEMSRLIDELTSNNKALVAGASDLSNAVLRTEVEKLRTSCLRALGTINDRSAPSAEAMHAYERARLRSVLDGLTNLVEGAT